MSRTDRFDSPHSTVAQPRAKTRPSAASAMPRTAAPDGARRAAPVRAAELAALYALALLRDTDFATLSHVRAPILTDGAPPLLPTTLCAGLRALGPSDTVVPADMTDILSLAAGLPVIHGADWSGGVPTDAIETAEAVMRPAVDAPLSAWLRWCEARHAAALPRPGRARATAPATPAALSRRLADQGAVPIFFVAALRILGDSALLRLDTPQRLLLTMSDLAARAAARIERAVPSDIRPGIVTGRLSLLRAGEPPAAFAGGDMAAEILSEIDIALPQLLVHVAQRNAARPLGATLAQRDHEPCDGWCPLTLHDNLELSPVTDVSGRRIHPERLRGQVFVAASLAAVIDACIDLKPEARRALDALVGDVALGCAALGGVWPSELAEQARRGAAFGAEAAVVALGRHAARVPTPARAAGLARLSVI